MAGLEDIFAGIESTRDPFAWTRLPSGRMSRYRGMFQFGPEQEARYGINDSNWTDPTVQRQAFGRHIEDLRGGLTRSLGREPSAGELYLAHQQGPAGAPALLAGGDTPAWQVIRPYYRSDRLAQQAITGNIPRQNPMFGRAAADISARDFANYWTGRVNRAAGMPDVPAAPSAPPITLAQATTAGNQTPAITRGPMTGMLPMMPWL